MPESFSPFSKLENLLPTDSPNPIREFIRKLKDPCADDPEDCGEIVCPECSNTLTTVFGSLPLAVQCSSCGKTYLLRDLINSAPIVP